MTPTDLDHLPLPHPDAFASYGHGADLDDAYDDATTTAGNTHGYTGTHPSLASTNPERVHPTNTPPTTAAATALRITELLTTTPPAPGHVTAYPVAPPSAFTRRRVRITLDDPNLHLPDTPGPVTHLTEELTAIIRTAIADTGEPVTNTETIETVDVTRARSRYKPVVETYRGKTQSTYAVWNPTNRVIVADDFPTAGTARRAAVELSKAGPLTDEYPEPPTSDLEIIRVTRRDTGDPYLRVTRTRIRQTVTLKVVLITEKNPDKTRTIGWAFTGTHPTPNTDDEPTTEPATA